MNATHADRAYLREWRLAKGLTQTELAKRTGTVKSEISRLEKGSRRMTLEWMSAFAKAMSISVEDLMTVPPMGFGAVSPAPRMGESHSRPSATLQLGDVGFDIEGTRHEVTTINGDDWSGTFSPGDILVYDTTRKSTAAPGIYVFEVGGETIVRRATPNGSSVMLSCTNPAYPPVAQSKGYTALGRVVARVHRV